MLIVLVIACAVVCIVMGVGIGLHWKELPLSAKIIGIIAIASFLTIGINTLVVLKQ